MAESLTKKCEKNINEIFDIISSSDNNKTFDSCIAYIVLVSVFLIINISLAIYAYFFLYLKNKSTNPHYFGCYYFYDDLINIKNVNSNNLKLDKKRCFGQ